MRGLRAWEDAILAYQEGLRLKPENVEALKCLAIAHVNKGASEEAAVAFKKVLTLKPDDDDTLAQIAHGQ